MTTSSPGGWHDTNWRGQAECADNPLWLIENPNRVKLQWMAGVCDGCPVKQDCHQEAENWRREPHTRRDGYVVTSPVGVWAGWFYSNQHQGKDPQPIPLPAA